MIANDINNILVPIVLDVLTGLIPLLLMIGIAVISLAVVLFAVCKVLELISPTFGGIASEFWSGYKSGIMDNFSGSSLGRAVSAYRERISVHDGAQIYVESYSLGPKEYVENEGSFSGYDYTGEMNIVPEDNVDLEDRGKYD